MAVFWDDATGGWWLMPSQEQIERRSADASSKIEVRGSTTWAFELENHSALPKFNIAAEKLASQ